MVTYRPADRYPETYAHRRESGGPFAVGRATAQTGVVVDGLEHLCLATAIEMPLRRTLAWAAKLPDGVLPAALMSRHARVADLIAAAWDDPESFGNYVDSLLTDAHRRGLAPAVVDEVHALRRCHETTTRRTCA